MADMNESKPLTTRELLMSLVRWAFTLSGVASVLAGAALGAVACAVASACGWVRGDPAAWWLVLPAYFGLMVAGNCASDRAESEFGERFYAWQNAGGWKWIGGLALAATIGAALAL